MPGPTGERADWWWYEPFQPQPPPTDNRVGRRGRIHQPNHSTLRHRGRKWVEVRAQRVGHDGFVDSGIHLLHASTIRRPPSRGRADGTVLDRPPIAMITASTSGGRSTQCTSPRGEGWRPMTGDTRPGRSRTHRWRYWLGGLGLANRRGRQAGVDVITLRLAASDRVARPEGCCRMQ